MTKPMDLVKLQKLLVVKLSEKFPINVRGLKSAFALYDKDGNGLLDLSELKTGLSMFLNGVNENDLLALVQAYDLNGDGMLSYEEFLAVLQNPKVLETAQNYKPPRPPAAASSNQYDNAPAKSFKKKGENKYADEDYDLFGNEVADARRADASRFPVPPPAPELPASRMKMRPNSARESSIFSFNDSETASVAESHIDLSSPAELEGRTRAFLHSLKDHLHQQALQLRQSGKAGNIRERLTMSSKDLLDGLARGLLSKAFQPFTGIDDGRSRQSESFDTYVELAEFAKVLRGFRIVGRGGEAALRVETIHFLFSLCHPDTGAMGGENLGLADPEILSTLVFGAQTLNPREKIAENMRNRAAGVGTESGEGADEVMGLSLVDRAERGRKVVDKGPVKRVSGKDREANAVPLRFVSRRSRSTFAVPEKFDKQSGQSFSSQEPSFDLNRHHVHGLAHKLHSGNAILSLASGSAANPNGMRSDPDYLDNSVVVYAAASMGVVHDLSNNTQKLFGGHDHDITCITLSNCTKYVATGCSGARLSCIHVWESLPSDQFGLTGEAPTSLAQVGLGFFDRAVCAVAFLEDPNFVCGIGCDDAHTLGIWDIREPSKAYLVSQTTQNGIPPQIKCMKWAPHQEYTEYITKSQKGLCDVGCTAGEHHLRLWSFRRPVTDKIGTQEVAQLSSRGAIFGEMQKQVQPPKTYTAVDFAPCSDKTSDIIAGGSNGVVYLFRKGKCIAFQNTIKGGVNCLQVCGDIVCCGGKSGSVICLNIRTLAIQLQCRAAYPQPEVRSLDGYVQASGRAISAVARPLSAASQASSRVSGSGMNSDDGLGDIVGLCVVVGTKGATHAIVASSSGRAMKVDFAKVLEARKIATSEAAKRGGQRDVPSLPTQGVSTLFYYHTGELWGLAVGSARSHHASTHLSRKLTLLASSCDDRRLSVWDPERRCLCARTTLPAASRCVDFHRSAQFIGVGTMAGSLHIYAMVVEAATRRMSTPGKGAAMATSTRVAREEAENRRSKQYTLTEVAFRRDFREPVSDTKFNPNGDMIAAASNDDTICVYACEVVSEHNKVTCTLKPLHRLRGHSSYITHIDWSRDGDLLRSTCGAYELLYWSITSGKQFTGPNADIAFKTDNCPLGFAMMGIWSPYMDGTDINAVDVGSFEDCPDRLVFCGDDNAKLSMINYPCVVKHAPRKEYTGHGSHVTNVRFYQTYRSRDSAGVPWVASTGGRDASIITWACTPTPVAPPIRKYVHKLN